MAAEATVRKMREFLHIKKGIKISEDTSSLHTESVAESMES